MPTGPWKGFISCTAGPGIITGNISDPYPALVTLDFPSRAELAQTGQNLCYDDIGLIVSCTATRQDGDTRAGFAWPVPRFTNPGGSTPISGSLVEDRLTGFTWARDGNLAATRGFDGDGMVSWENALAFIETLNAGNYGGHSDWRLPNRNELSTLINRQRSDNAAWLGTQGFANVKPDPLLDLHHGRCFPGKGLDGRLSGRFHGKRR